MGRSQTKPTDFRNEAAKTTETNEVLSFYFVHSVASFGRSVASVRRPPSFTPFVNFVTRFVPETVRVLRNRTGINL
jgi:hypothetical protein